MAALQTPPGASEAGAGPGVIPPGAAGPGGPGLPLAGGGSGGGAICSGNSEGFGGIGRIITSSIMGSRAAATAALAAASIASGVCDEGMAGALMAVSGSFPAVQDAYR